MWVQSLGGLHFPKDSSEVCVEMIPVVQQFLCVTASSCSSMLMSLQGVSVGSSLSASHMENTMKLLRGRLQARLALHKQFASLGTIHVNHQGTNSAEEEI